jgi:hypothetical protein
MWMHIVNIFIHDIKNHVTTPNVFLKIEQKGVTLTQSQATPTTENFNASACTCGYYERFAKNF